MGRPHALACFLTVASACQPGATPVDGGPSGHSDVPVRPTDSAVPDASGDAPAASDAGDLAADVPDDAPTSRVLVLVAQGEIGRTVVSCDGGRTWSADRDWEDEADPLLCGSETRCAETACQYRDGTGTCVSSSACGCDHHPGAPKGITYADGLFVATWGWGPPGSVRVSGDGVAWTEVVGGRRFGGVAASGARVVLGARVPMLSVNSGESFAELPRLSVPTGEGNVRRVAHVGGVFAMYFHDGTGALMLSDDGDTWRSPESVPSQCLGVANGFVELDDRIVWVNATTSCVSDDRGAHWTAHALPAMVSSDVVLGDDGLVRVWGARTSLESTDGERWTVRALTTPLTLREPVSATGDGGFVAVLGRYDAQRWYRSDDGVTWTELDAASAPRGHRIRYIARGLANTGAVCPP